MDIFHSVNRKIKVYVWKIGYPQTSNKIERFHEKFQSNNVL
jgi:hypothetical protein